MHIPDTHDVVVTGGGCVSCLGMGEDTLRSALQEQRSGLKKITMVPPVVTKTQVGGQIDRTPFTAALRAARIRYDEITMDASALAAEEALQQAGILQHHEAPRNIATIVGAGASSVERYFAANETFFTKGARWVRPTTVPRCMNNAIGA